MNTLKKILGLLVLTALLLCTVLSFASCQLPTLPGIGGGNTDGEGDGEGDNVEDGKCKHGSECTCFDVPATPSETPEVPTTTNYVVVVRDDVNSFVPGVKVGLYNGTQSFEKVTDDNGYLSFNVNKGTWVAQIVSAPSGYEFDKTVKYEFDSTGVAAITLIKPEGYSFTVSSADEGAVVPEGTEIVLYSASDLETPVAIEAIDADGKVFFEVPAGSYVAVVNADGFDPMELEILPAKSSFDVVLSPVLGTIPSAPIFSYGSIWETVEAGKTLYFNVMASGNRYLVIESADVVVNYNGKDYSADDNGVVTVAISDSAADAFGNIAFSITNTSDEDIEVNGEFAYDEGHMDNPKLIESLDEIAIVEVKKSDSDNSVCYLWNATYSGTLILNCPDSDVNVINLVNLNTYDSAYQEAGDDSVSISFAKEDPILISVGTMEETDTGFAYPKATLAISAVSYVEYSVTLENCSERYMVMFIDADSTDLVAAVTVDYSYTAKVLLPAGNYFAMVSAELEDYEFELAELSAENSQVTLALAPIPGVFPESPIVVEADENGEFVDFYFVPAGETYYFTTSDANGYKFIVVAETEFVLTVGGSDIVAECVDDIYVASVDLPADAPDAEAPAVVAFSITNTDAIDIIASFATAEIVREPLEAPAEVATPAEGEGTVESPFAVGADAYTATLIEAGATVYYAVSVVADGDYVLTAYGADYKIGYGADLEALTYVTFDDANVISLSLTASAPLYVVVANNGDAVADVTFSIAPILE